jgi:hypothetical protein
MMRIRNTLISFIFGCSIALLAGLAHAQPGGCPFNDTHCLSTSTGATTAVNNGDRFGEVIDIADFGAKCDGVTNDTTAINNALAYAAASPAYTNNNGVLITGPRGGNQTGCFINSLNMTIFQRGTGANLRPAVVLRDLTLLCSGAGNDCIDAQGSKLVSLQNVRVRGNTGSLAPERCIVFGVLADNTSAAWNSMEHVDCNNEFTFTAFYNNSSEAFTCVDCKFANAHQTTGVLATLGSITGGSSYTNGTYSPVFLTGGTGNSAQATVVVSGNAVTSVTIIYQGRDYTAGDTLSANASGLGGTGSGFSVPVATTTTYAGVLDGQNYWRSTSGFQTITATPNAWNSLTLNSFINTHFPPAWQRQAIGFVDGLDGWRPSLQQLSAEQLRLILPDDVR